MPGSTPRIQRSFEKTLASEWQKTSFFRFRCPFTTVDARLTAPPWMTRFVLYKTWL